MNKLELKPTSGFCRSTVVKPDVDMLDLIDSIDTRFTCAGSLLYTLVGEPKGAMITVDPDMLWLVHIQLEEARALFDFFSEKAKEARPNSGPVKTAEHNEVDHSELGGGSGK